jgi:3-oxoacyl-[acyl-carrier protein] reductase
MAREEIDKHRQAILDQIPLRRIGLPMDVAGAVLFLASPLADYLNGATLDINGGSWFH